MSDPLRDHVASALADRYAVDAELGRGAMAVVYRAREVRLRRVVALKVLPPELAFRPGVRERFLREAQTAAQLSHPNIVPVYSAGDDGGVAWLAMALVDGETLADRLARAPRPTVDEARRILVETADALAYAHARGVVHRDVKPENILLDRETGRVMVADFGIARAAEDDGRLTGTGVTLGTPAYMSPEQAMGETEVDGRADQYALGVVGYQLLTGTLPFQATNATGMLMKHVGEVPRPVRERVPQIPPALAYAVERALAKKPTDRWPDAGAFREALRSDRLPASTAYPRNDDLAPAAAFAEDIRRRAEASALAPVPPLPPWMPPRAPQPPAVGALAIPRADRASRDEWKEYARAQRVAERERREAWREAARSGLVPAPLAPEFERRALGPDGVPEIPLDVRVSLFRRKAIGGLVLIAFLTCINAMHLFIPPWVVFPAWGVAADLRRRWRPLGTAGLEFWDVLFNGQGALTRLEGERRHGPPRTALTANVRRLRRRAAVAAAIAGVAVCFFLLAIASHVGPLVVFAAVAMLAALGTSFGAAREAAPVRRAGVSLGDALSPGWRAAVDAAAPRPRSEVVDDELRQLAAATGAGNGTLAMLRDAVEDRVTVRETLAKLSPEDRALLPVADVMPTVDGLVERVADLAGRLERFPPDANPAALAAVDARLAAPVAPTAEGERTRQLLERQRASLADLLARRTELEAKLESARAALRNVRFDLLKLRDDGVGALAQVSTATQQARALSRDIGHALAAAAEARNA
ncbi:MAG TPA: serine/threonine-protein kinase [Gemmatirosa sp.]